MNKSIYACIQKMGLDGKCTQTDVDAFYKQARDFLLVENYNEFNNTFSKVVNIHLDVRKRKFCFYKDAEGLTLVVDTNECVEKDDIDAATTGGIVYSCILDAFYMENINLKEDIFKYCEDELGITYGFEISEEEIKEMNKELENIIKEIKTNQNQE